MLLMYTAAADETLAGLDSGQDDSGGHVMAFTRIRRPVRGSCGGGSIIGTWNFA